MYSICHKNGYYKGNVEAVDVVSSGGGYIINCPIDDIHRCNQIYGSEAIKYVTSCKGMVNYRVTCAKVDRKTISAESLLRQNGHVWYILSHQDTFVNSQKTCKVLNMDLATLKTPAKSDSLRFAMGQTHLVLDYWIGLFKDGDVYKWVDKEVQSTTIGQWDRSLASSLSTSNENCVKLIGTDEAKMMKWQPESCRKLHQGICEAQVSSYEELFECTMCAETNIKTKRQVKQLEQATDQVLLQEDTYPWEGSRSVGLKPSHISAIVTVPLLAMAIVISAIYIRKNGMPPLPPMPNLSSHLPSFTSTGKDELLIDNEETENEAKAEPGKTFVF